MISIGLDTYWRQFPELLDEMKAKTNILIRKLSANSVTVSDFGMVDNAQAAYDALPKIKASDPDVLFAVLLSFSVELGFKLRLEPCFLGYNYL